MGVSKIERHLSAWSAINRLNLIWISGCASGVKLINVTRVSF